MVGTFADVVVADAIVKNVPNFDLTLAKEALLRDVSYLCANKYKYLFMCCMSHVVVTKSA